MKHLRQASTLQQRHFEISILYGLVWGDRKIKL